MQKYERGANRVGSSRLFEISRILDVPASFFFEEISSETASAGPLTVSGGSPNAELEEFQRDPLAKRETLELVRAYYRITDP